MLSLPEKRHGGWSEAEFFETGEREIAGVLAHARERGLEVRAGRALDFGCGVGRLTQALAPHFERVDGVDIAPSMLELARRYDRHPGRCFYHLNDRSDLGLFPDGAFSFVYSSLVLQHLPPELTRGYLRELLRVLAPGGLLVFHLPSERFPAGAGGPRRTSAARGPLAPDGFRARLETEAAELEAAASHEAALKLRVVNQSARAWPALGGASARHQITLAGRFLTPAGEPVDSPEARSSLPHDVAPGSAVELFLRVALPRWPGAYQLELDLVQEGVAWFHERSGRAPLRLPCRARGDPQGAPRLRSKAPPPEPGAFRRRHPRAHFVLARLLRLPDVRNAVAQAGSALAWHARMSWWHARERVRRLLDPPMAMNGMPRADVEALIREAGGRMLEAESSELTFAGWQAFRYWVVREARLSA